MDRFKRAWKDANASAFLEYGFLVGLIMAAGFAAVILAGQWAVAGHAALQ